MMQAWTRLKHKMPQKQVVQVSGCNTDKWSLQKADKVSDIQLRVSAFHLNSAVSEDLQIS